MRYSFQIHLKSASKLYTSPYYVNLITTSKEPTAIYLFRSQITFKVYMASNPIFVGRIIKEVDFGFRSETESKCLYYLLMKTRYIQKTISQEQADNIRLRGRKEPKYYNKVYIHVTAAAKMLSHAHFGIPRQVMGLLQGSYHQEQGKGVFVISDVVYLPVESSETRVTADDQTHTLIASYTEWFNKINTHHIVGWYHSHPSFGCWLSGIDVNTQQLFQNSADPFIALVIDPIKSLNLQKLDLAAFRVHPKGYKQESLAAVKDVPRRKAVDYGFHYQRYYQLPVEFVTSDTGMKTLKKVQKVEWVNQIALSSFFKQSEYLTEQVNDEKLDIQQYLEVREHPGSKMSEIKQKERTTMKKVAFYTKERNISLIDSAVKSLMF